MVAAMERKSFYDESTYQDLRERVDRLTGETEPRWGKMSAAQMCAHCAEVVEVANGKPLLGTPWFIRLLGGVIKRMVLSNRPYPRNGRTHPQYEIDASLDFGEQQARLLAALNATYSAGTGAAEETRHPLFGTMTAEEAGWAAYKHLDHHLTQFGV